MKQNPIDSNIMLCVIVKMADALNLKWSFEWIKCD